MINCKCGNFIEIENCWESLGNTILCPKCNNSSILCYEDYYDEAVEIEYGLFFLVDKN